MYLFSPLTRFYWEGRWNSGFVEPRRRLFDCLLVYTSKGSFQLEIGQTLHRMHAGSIAIISPDIWHESRVADRAFAVRHCVHFDWLPQATVRQRAIASFPGDAFPEQLVSTVPPDIARHLPLVYHIDRADEALVATLAVALPMFRRHDPAANSLLWGILNLLLMRQSDQRPAASPLSRAALTVWRVRDYIETHFDRPQGYDTYRQLSGLSTSHLCQLFSSLVGRPPLAYLIDIRLQHALRLLRESDLSIKEVGNAVGIRDPNYFSRLFRKRFERNPRDFRTA